MRTCPHLVLTDNRLLVQISTGAITKTVARLVDRQRQCSLIMHAVLLANSTIIKRLNVML